MKRYFALPLPPPPANCNLQSYLEPFHLPQILVYHKFVNFYQKRSISKGKYLRKVHIKCISCLVTEPQAISRVLENSGPGRPSRENETKEQNNLVFSVQHSRDNKELKKLIHDLEPDIKRLCGEIKVIFATWKHPSIGNRIVKNRQLGQPKQTLIQKLPRNASAGDAKPAQYSTTCPT